MYILVLNAGSSSLKTKLFQKSTLKVVHEAYIERIAKNQHEKALKQVLVEIQKKQLLKNLPEISAIGHRVVHGGEEFSQSTIITAKVLTAIKKYAELAPLHNPANIAGITACQKLIPSAKNVAVFDTAFHQTMPKTAYLYAIPQQLYQKYHIRRYGFHGTSHQYVAEISRTLLGHQKSQRVITCHLGNGCSITAIKNGRSIDTSMGFTPLEGLIMGTRSGDLDPAIVFYLQEKGYQPHEIDQILNHKSGLLAISEKYHDMRDIWHASQKKDPKAQLALDMFVYRIVKYIGAYTAILGNLDSLIFTGGIGENAWYIRKAICDQLNYLKLKIDSRQNRQTITPHRPKIISNLKSAITVLVIPTNEELAIAHQVSKLTK